MYGALVAESFGGFYKAEKASVDLSDLDQHVINVLKVKEPPRGDH